MMLDLASRRAFASAMLALPLASLKPRPAFAFKNALPAHDPESKKTPGAKPELGVRPVGSQGGWNGAGKSADLQSCLDGKPHCFSSSPALNAAGTLNEKAGTDWLVQPWSCDKPLLTALQDLRDAVAAYPPGQAGIDGGGFQVANFWLPETAADVGYLYVQFESLEAGYIDDMEFVVAPGGLVNVRTSSRLGFADFGANAKRYNWFAKQMAGVKGWKTSPVREKDHPNYFAQNDLTDQDVSI